MAQSSKVTIVQDELGNVIRISKNNPDYGHVRLTQDAVTYTATGWVKKQSRSTLLHGEVEDLKAVNIQKKKTLPGCIYIVEQFEGFSTDNPDRDLKVAGLTGIILKGTNTVTGEVDAPIYRKSFYDVTGTMEDVLVPHTNGQEIREANSDKTMNAMKQNITDESMIKDENQIDLEDAIAEVEETDNIDQEVEIEEEVKEEEVVEENASFEL